MKVSKVAAMATAVAFGLGAAVSAGPLEAHAAGPVAKYVLAPSPIAAAGSLAAGATVAVTLTAEDSTGAAVPSATVFLAFKQAKTGGGSATAGTGAIALTLKPQSFVADTSGHIAISYHAHTPLATNGEDVITAQNTASLPTIKATDHYIYNSVTKYAVHPRPIAATASLAGNATVVVTLTALNSTGTAVPSAVVYLFFIPATGGGSAMVGTTALTGTPVAFTANSSGVISITYKTPAVRPTSGVDTIKARSAPTHPIVVGSDTYTF
jgi:hypothetical protein